MTFGGDKPAGRPGPAYLRWKLLALGQIIALVAPFLMPAVSYAEDDYPEQWRVLRMDAAVDNWGMFSRECTSFVAWRLAGRNGFEMPFHANASAWKRIALDKGFAADETPAPGAVAWTPSHVAWVESVDEELGLVTVEEYNNVDSNGNGRYGDDGTYGRRTVPASAFAAYIHFKDLPPVTMAQLTPLGKNRLEPGEELWAGEYLASANGQYVLVMRRDGDLVFYDEQLKEVWTSNTAGSGATAAVMRNDGGLTLLDNQGNSVWNSGHRGEGSSVLMLQDDGRLVVQINDWRTILGERASYVLGSSLPENLPPAVESPRSAQAQAYVQLLRDNDDFSGFKADQESLLNFMPGPAMATGRR